jgi:hypothetical protein
VTAVDAARLQHGVRHDAHGREARSYAAPHYSKNRLQHGVRHDAHGREARSYAAHTTLKTEIFISFDNFHWFEEKPIKIRLIFIGWARVDGSKWT